MNPNKLTCGTIIAGLLLLLPASVRAAEEKYVIADAPSYTMAGGTNSITSLRGPTHLIFQSGIDINAETGEVVLPKSLKLSDAARSFWNAIAEAYPNVRYDLMHPPVSIKEPANSVPGKIIWGKLNPEIGRIEFGNSDSSTILVLYKGAHVISVSGLPRLAEPEVPKYEMRPFTPPETADSVKVELTTKDGRVWRAKWEEKP